MKILASNGDLHIELPDINTGQMARIQEAVGSLLDSKFFNMSSGRITLFIHDGFVMKVGIYIEEKARELDKRS